jgi:hypothetical protein
VSLPLQISASFTLIAFTSFAFCPFAFTIRTFILGIFGVLLTATGFFKAQVPLLDKQLRLLVPTYLLEGGTGSFSRLPREEFYSNLALIVSLFLTYSSIYLILFLFLTLNFTSKRQYDFH